MLWIIIDNNLYYALRLVGRMQENKRRFGGKIETIQCTVTAGSNKFS